MESTFQGYISSTHDALLIFECVRRGHLPKVKRRLREEERKCIKSGQVFVFDEKESGIKRWTDGLLWSPSRILWNFLVYRQVDKKFGGRDSSVQGSQEGSPRAGADAALYGTDLHRLPLAGTDPYALGVDPSDPFSTAPIAMSLPHSTRLVSPASLGPSGSLPSRIQAVSSASDNPWHASGLVGFDSSEANAMPLQQEMDDEKNLVGSLRSSYPFAKGGLCKKTISIQVGGSTQHLISYYTVEDVRSGRLRTPSSLPEIASLSISPELLAKTSFRFPPATFQGPDGITRFRGEDLGMMEPSADSSGEGTSSGSDTHRRQRQRQQRQLHQRIAGLGTTSPGSMSYQEQDLAFPALDFTQVPNRAVVSATGRLPAATTSPISMRAAPLAHQIGGSGVYRPSRRSSDASLRVNPSRYEPYPAAVGRLSTAGSSDSTSPSSTPATPYHGQGASAGSRMEVLTQSPGLLPYPVAAAPTTSIEGHYGHEVQQRQQQSHKLDRNSESQGVLVADGLNPYPDSEDERQRMLKGMLAEQQPHQTQYGMHQSRNLPRQQRYDSEPWPASADVQHEELRQRALANHAQVNPVWTSPKEEPAKVATGLASTSVELHLGRLHNLFDHGFPPAAQNNWQQPSAAPLEGTAAAPPSQPVAYSYFTPEQDQLQPQLPVGSSHSVQRPSAALNSSSHHYIAHPYLQHQSHHAPQSQPQGLRSPLNKEAHQAGWVRSGMAPTSLALEQPVISSIPGGVTAQTLGHNTAWPPQRPLPVSHSGVPQPFQPHQQAQYQGPGWDQAQFYPSRPSGR